MVKMPKNAKLQMEIYLARSIKRSILRLDLDFSGPITSFGH
jgi:hypothetical protein